MAVVFSPLSGTTIIDTDEAQTNVSALVSISVLTGDDITDVSWSVTPALPPQAVVETDIAVDGESATLTVTFPDFIGVVPIIAIDYLLNGVLGTVTSWNDVPEAAEQIISYEKSITGPMVHTLSVDVTETGSDPGITSASFTIRVEPNYDAGRDALIAAVDARR